MEIILVMWVAWVVFTAVVANAKGRSGWAWGTAAVFFGVFALIGVACTSNLKSQRERAERHAELLEAARGVARRPTHAYVRRD